MAQRVQPCLEIFSCSVCLDVLKEPVALPCGHSYCMSCIQNVWDEKDGKKTYSCPQCRQTFTQRPVLVKNSLLATLVEQLQTTGVQAAAAAVTDDDDDDDGGDDAADGDDRSAGCEEVACDVCTDSKSKALKSCLQCLVSYCEKHLQPHYGSAAFEKHKLIDPSEKLRENVCPRHGEAMKMFCRTDQQIICYLCPVEQHKGHNTVSAAVERTERQRELEASLQERIQDREKDAELLQQEVEAIGRSADRAVAESEEIFTGLIQLIQEKSLDVKRQIRSQEEMEVRRVQGVQEKLQQELRDLRKKDAELKLLSRTEDHSHFLNSVPSLSQVSENTDSHIEIRPLRYFENVTVAGSELRDKIQDVLTEAWTNLTLTVTDVDVLLLPPEPRTRADFFKYARKITLDPNTAHADLLLSDENGKAERMSQQQVHSSHADRFTTCHQVLSRECLTGRCYWEVEWTGSGLYVAVAYRSISRAGTTGESGFGRNEKSWALHCCTSNYTFWAKSLSTPVTGPETSRVGVYLDHRAGVLSFYSVSDTMTLLHRVQTTFTQPLHAGLYLYGGATAEFCKLK